MVKDNQLMANSVSHTETITHMLWNAMLPVLFLQYFKYRGWIRTGAPQWLDNGVVLIQTSVKGLGIKVNTRE